VGTADFNRDGKLDLVLSYYDSNVLYFLLGNGDGTFQAPVYFAVASTPSGQGSYLGLAVGHFNHDGWPDVAAGIGSYIAVVTNQPR
jgi:hypothetical protein